MRISDWSSDVCSSDLYWKGDALPSARHAAFEPLRIPIFRRFWFSSMASNFGGLIQTVAAAWMMTALTGNAEMVALVQTSATLPMMLISLPAGSLADIYERRNIMLIAQSAIDRKS